MDPPVPVAAADLPVPVAAAEPTNATRRAEVLVVLLLSLVASGAYAILTLFTAPVRGGRTVLTRPPARLTDLVRDLLDIGFALVPVLLVGHLLHRERERWADLRLAPRRDALRADLAQGAAIAAVIGAAGLAFYIGAVRLGINRTVIPVVGDGPWWSVPVLVLEAAENAVLEEVVVLAYLLHRLHQIGWSDRAALLASSLLRGSYHLYQGYGAFAANALMGLLFGRWYQKGRRALPLVVAHFLIDAVVFVGYPLVRTRWSWLPR